MSRKLRTDEIALISFLLEGAELEDILTPYVDSFLVEDMKDGGMGSLRFLYDCEHSYGGVIVDAEYIDLDGVLVLISLIRTKENQLYELDVFKGDFSPLKKFPKASEILNKRIFN